MLLDGGLNFGPYKKAAYSLLMAKLFNSYPVNGKQLSYITLGGTEMFDVVLLNWIEKTFCESALSYETNADRYKLAVDTANRLKARGINIEVREESIFDYRRINEYAHLFFIDLTGVLKHEPFTDYFHDWFDTNTIRAGDFIFITSYLGRNPGWEKVLEPFDPEFRSLRVDQNMRRRTIYQVAHPLFVLLRALRRCKLEKELQLDCFAYIKYKDTSPMGLYGIAVTEGQTILSNLVSRVPVMDFIKKDWASSVHI